MLLFLYVAYVHSSNMNPLASPHNLLFNKDSADFNNEPLQNRERHLPLGINNTPPPTKTH